METINLKSAFDEEGLVYQINLDSKFTIEKFYDEFLLITKGWIIGKYKTHDIARKVLLLVKSFFDISEQLNNPFLIFTVPSFGWDGDFESLSVNLT